jgi:cwf21 domain
MSSNVGLTTPRGSGTSGYVQRNLSLLKPRDAGIGQPYSLNDRDRAPRARKPDQNILQHDRLREIEVKVLELRDTLEEEAEKAEEDGKEGLSDEVIEERCEELRKRLTEEMERDLKKGRGASGGGRGLKSYQVHELAEAKERESERLRRALGLRGDETGDDGEHPMARQDKRRREKEMDDARRDEDRAKREIERGR